MNQNRTYTLSWSLFAARPSRCGPKTDLQQTFQMFCQQLFNQNLLFTIRKIHLLKYIEYFTTKNWKFSDKNSDIFHFSAQNIDCGYLLEPLSWGGSVEFPQSMFLSRNKNNNVYPCKAQLFNIKVGFKGVKFIYGHVFVIPWYLFTARPTRYGPGFTRFATKTSSFSARSWKCSRRTWSFFTAICEPKSSQFAKNLSRCSTKTFKYTFRAYKKT